jgi:hypothetical protein
MSAVEAVAKDITAEQRTRVEELLRQRDLSPRQRERLEMVKASALGKTGARSWPGVGAPRARWSGGCTALGQTARGPWRMRRGQDAPAGLMPPIGRH